MDYMVMEAVALKVQREDAKAQKERERKAAMEAERKRLAKMVS